MDLSKVAVVVKTRNHWQAVDVGFQMARRFFVPLTLLWWALALPFALVATTLLYDYPVVMFMCVWWFKPLYELPQLYYLSRVMFGETPGYRECLRAVVASKKDLVLLLTIRRLSPSRSFVAPVSLLEGLSGSKRADRIKILSPDAGGVAQWLLFICYQFELVLYFGLLLIPTMIVPAELLSFDPFNVMFSESTTGVIVSQIAFILTMSLVAPFYVAAGFQLYIGKRIELEGWDIELAFKRLQLRLHSGVMQSLLLASCLLMFGWLNPSPSHANEIDAAKEVIETVLEGPEFGETKTRKEWRYIGETEEEETNWPEWLKDFFKSIAEFFDAIAKAVSSAAPVVQVLFWVAIVSTGLWLAIYIRKHFFKRNLTTNRFRPQPTSSFSAEKHPEILSNIYDKVGQQLSANNFRGALSLLYQGSLQHLSRSTNIALVESLTEQECLHLLSQHKSPSDFDYFRRITNLWIKVAYAGALPEHSDIAELHQQWPAFSDDKHV